MRQIPFLLLYFILIENEFHIFYTSKKTMIIVPAYSKKDSDSEKYLEYKVRTNKVRSY
jgi:hypothetical protein